LKATGMDWTEVFAAEAENPRARLAAELLTIAAYGSTVARVKAFLLCPFREQLLKAIYG
jgi:hypothetical protein